MQRARTSGYLFFLLLSCAFAWDLLQNLETKTPYWRQQDPSTYTAPPGTCYPVHLNLVARHGTRQPTSKNVKLLNELQKNIQKNKDAITNPQLQWIFSWQNPFMAQDAGYLVYRGEMEHYALAKSFLSDFPELLNATYEPSRYPFRNTQISRTGISANSFGYGFFEGRGQVGPAKYLPFFSTAANLTLDVELRFFDVCPKYNKSILNDPSVEEEKSLYSKMVLPNIASQLTSQLGTNKWNLTTTDAKAFWSACTFQASVENVVDQFCAMFSQDSVEQLNYIADLSSYYVKGYGNAIDYTIACPLLTNFMDSIDDVITGPVDEHAERANLRFAHAETIMPFVALLGLYKDSAPLKHDDPPEVIKNRQWRSSLIAPYASNVAFVLYNCTAPTDTQTSFKIKVMVNEKEMTLPGCEGLYCPVERVKELYAEHIGCDFNKLCDVRSCGDEDNDNDDNEWSITQKGGMLVAITAGVSGILIGMVMMGVVLVLVHRCKKSREGDDYALLDASTGSLRF